MYLRLQPASLLAATAIPLALLGCGPGAATDPTGTLISAADGGVVRDADGHTTLTVPPGALAEDTEITLAILTKAANAVVDISEFGPDGLTFLTPATLAIQAEASLATTGKELVLAVEQDGVFVPVEGASYAGGLASGPVAHFSRYAVALFDGGADTSDTGADTDLVADSDIGDTDTGDTQDGSACQPTGGLTPPAAGRSVFDITFSNPSSDYNGFTSPFASFDATSIADHAGQSRWVASNKAIPPVDDELRSITVAVAVDAKACEAFTTTNTASNQPSINYVEGGPQTPNGSRSWWCGGVIVVDTLVGDADTFHFEADCKAAAAGTTAKGTVHIKGRGAGTFNAN